jgi:hypothetical protein
MSSEMHKGMRINIPRMPSSEVGHREVAVIKTLIDGVCESVRDIFGGNDINVDFEPAPNDIRQRRRAIISLSQEYKNSVATAQRTDFEQTEVSF